MLCCGAWPNLGYRLDKPWLRPFTANYTSDSRIIFVICISLARFHSTAFGTASCRAHCCSSSTLWRGARDSSRPPIKLEVNAFRSFDSDFMTVYVHYASSDNCHSVFCACSFQPISEILIFKWSNLINFAFFSSLTLGPFFVIQNLNWAMTRVQPCHWSNQRYALACA